TQEGESQSSGQRQQGRTDEDQPVWREARPGGRRRRRDHARVGNSEVALLLDLPELADCTVVECAVGLRVALQTEKLRRDIRRQPDVGKCRLNLLPERG